MHACTHAHTHTRTHAHTHTRTHAYSLTHNPARGNVSAQSTKNISILMYRWDLNVAGVLDVGYTISQAQSMFTPLQHVRAAEQEERLCCVVCVCVCVCGACVYTYID